MFNNLFNSEFHKYTLDATGMKIKTEIFYSRANAEEQMYKIINKKGLKLVEIYNDKHYKTYICSNGVRFYIHRAF